LVPNQLLESIGLVVSDVAPIRESLPIAEVERGEFCELKAIRPEHIQTPLDIRTQPRDHRHDANDGKYSDRDSEHGQSGTELVGRERRERKAERFQDVHS
jgi:hypothetical protein